MTSRKWMVVLGVAMIFGALGLILFSLGFEAGLFMLASGFGLALGAAASMAASARRGG